MDQLFRQKAEDKRAWSTGSAFFWINHKIDSWPASVAVRCRIGSLESELALLDTGAGWSVIGGDTAADIRLDNEQIAIFIPARNIETWIHYSLGNMDCNENDDYKKHYTADDARMAAKIFANKICVNGLPQNALSSLHHACAELERLRKI